MVSMVGGELESVTLQDEHVLAEQNGSDRKKLRLYISQARLLVSFIWSNFPDILPRAGEVAATFQSPPCSSAYSYKLFHSKIKMVNPNKINQRVFVHVH